jgi:hypothetical protein
LFLQGCTIDFHRFVSNCTVIWFEPLKNLIFQNISPNYKLDSKTKPFDDENLAQLCLYLFILCSLHTFAQIQHDGYIRAFLFSIWTPVTWPSTHSRSNISMGGAPSGRKPEARVLIPVGYLYLGKALAKSRVHQQSRVHGVWVAISLVPKYGCLPWVKKAKI